MDINNMKRDKDEIDLLIICAVGLLICYVLILFFKILEEGKLVLGYWSMLGTLMALPGLIYLNYTQNKIYMNIISVIFAIVGIYGFLQIFGILVLQK